MAAVVAAGALLVDLPLPPQPAAAVAAGAPLVGQPQPAAAVAAGAPLVGRGGLPQ